MSKTYRPYDPDQQLLLPAALREWLPDDHLAYFISDVVDELELSEITARYERESRGGPPYHPRMMVKVLLYGYCVGVASSRRIAQRLHEDIAFRVLAANNTPDFRTISDFRKDNLEALSGLFLQVLALCRRAGLVAAFVSVVALLVLASAAFALSNEQWRNDLDDVGGVSHRSKVVYTKQAYPFIAYIDYLKYGGRVHPADGFGECCGQWRHHATKYQRWTGTKWKSVRTKGTDSTWHSTGEPDDLHYETFGDNVDLHGGALVRQRIQYQRLRIVGDHSAWLKVGGRWNDHFLE